MRIHHQRLVLTAIIAGLGLFCSVAEAGSKTTKTSRAFTKPVYIETAETVDLFQGMKDGQLETKVIANGPFGGTLLISNVTDQPLTVAMPQTFATVHVLKQFGAPGGIGGGGGGLGGGGGGLGGGGQQGGQQGQGGGGQGGFGGGGQGGGGLGGGGQGGGGAGFFSIPAEKTFKYPYNSVCMNHGKDDPTPRSTRIIVPIEEFTADPVLHQLVAMVASGRLPAQAAQAAVWNRTDNLSWQQLASKTKADILGRQMPYFGSGDIRSAQVIAATAEGRARELAQNKPAEENAVPVEGRVR